MSPLVVKLELAREQERKRKLKLERKLERERERKLKLSGGLMPVPPNFNGYTHRLGFLCLAWSVYPAGGCIQWTSQERDEQKTKNRQTPPRSSAGSRPTLPKFSGYVEVDAHYIFHPSTIWVRPLFTELGPKKPPFCHKANEYMSP